MDFVNSTTFIKRPSSMTDVQEKFIYTKKLLSGRIFLGCYQERRYVALLEEYRDVIIISPEETDLHRDIDKINKKLLDVKEIKWVGITGPYSVAMPKVYCFWSKLSDIAFGCYWFQIKHVKLLDAEIILQFKCIRKSQEPLIAITSQVNQESVSEKKYEKGETSTPKSFFWDLDTRKTISTFQASCIRTINLAQPFLTWKNLFFVVKITCALFITLVMGIISLIGHLGEYSLKLIREITLLVNAFTPIVIQLIDFLTKVIGGLYILIAGMFIRNLNQPNPYRNNNNIYSVTYSNATRPSSLAFDVDWRERNRMLRQELLPDTNKRN